MKRHTPTPLLTLLLMSSGLLLAACDATSSTPDSDELHAVVPGDAASARGERVADLSVRLQADSNDTSEGDLGGDSLYVDFRVDLVNVGPHAASGVRLAFRSPADCVPVARGGNSDDAGDIILWDIVEGVAGGGDGDDLDIILWDIIDGVQPGTLTTLGVVCPVSSAGNRGTVEIMASDAYDPDSVPGDGNPRQDDYATVTL